MHFQNTSLQGVVIVTKQPVRDERGEFSRVWCRDEFDGLMPDIQQASSVRTGKAGTVRGLHFQRAPNEEAKYIRCLRGRAFVVAVDMRRDSRTYRSHFALELDAEQPKGLFVDKGFAQGYQTLEDDTEILYFMSTGYAPESASGYRYDDPALAIRWPIAVAQVSQRDREWELCGDV